MIIPSNILDLWAPISTLVSSTVGLRGPEAPVLLIRCTGDSLGDVGLGIGLALSCPGEACRRVWGLLEMVGVAAEVMVGCKDVVCRAGMACGICGGTGRVSLRAIALCSARGGSKAWSLIVQLFHAGSSVVRSSGRESTG